MSKIKIIEGVEYIQKDSVDEIVRSRIAKYSEKLTAAESRISEFESQLDEAKAKSGLVDNLTSQMETLKGELLQANSRYERHSTISSHGISDPSIRDAVEWAYDKQMSDLPKKDRIGLGDWLSGINSNPETAPAFLRPFFGQKASSQNPPPQNQTPQIQPSQNPPPTNSGIAQREQTSATQNDLLQKAGDRDFFDANREAIREAYYASKGGKSPFKF